eukprot:1186655-Prorocentrum_minimum.AAC.2
MWVTGPRLDRDGRRASLHTSTLQGKYAACTRVGGEARTSAVYEQYGVLHLRNLPWDCTVEDLKGLCENFGQVVQTKLNVGANKNQAFVEFADVNQAVTMLNFYGTSSEPAQACLIPGAAVCLVMCDGVLRDNITYLKRSRCT